MASVKFYLDCRRVKADGGCQLKLAVCHKCKTRYVALGVSLLPEQWDGVQVVKHRMAGRMNALLKLRMAQAQVALMECGADDVVTMHAAVARALGGVPEPEVPVEERPRDLLLAVYERWMGMKRGKTAASYGQTLSRLRAFCGEDGLSRLRLGDITRAWLMEWDAFLQGTMPSANARAVYMRNLRAVMNFAIDEGLTDNYPFRRFKIKTVATVKRSLSVEDLRELIGMEVDDWQREYRDMWVLSFMLMGVNFKDLLRLPVGADAGGRLEFARAKTGHLYSMRVELEARVIIDRWRGEGWMLDVMDRYKNHEDFLRRTNKALAAIGETRLEKHGRKVCTPRFPGLTTYWARHTWATVAASLDIPKETIAAALGHGGNTVTDVYIDFDRGKVDEANRRVLDWVLYGRR